MIKRHKGRFAKAAAPASNPGTPVSAPANEAETPAAVAAPHALAVPDKPPAPDALLGTVSPDALQVAAIETQPLPIVKAAPAASEPSDDRAQRNAARSGDPSTETTDTVAAPPEVAPAPHEAAPVAAEAAVPPEPVPPAVVPQPPAAAPFVAGEPQPALDAVAEFAQVNATLVAYLQSEGRAALTHWRALAAAASPADAIRLQVGEMQRAADASLTCFSVLAKRATRVAEAVRPR
jgi:hypothetical protein